MRVGTVAVFNSTGRPSSNVIEARGDDIAGYDPFAAASAVRERILFELLECLTDCLTVRLDEAVIVSDQPLNAHRLRGVEGRVPADAPVVVRLEELASARRTFGSGLELLRTVRKGAVDYSAVPELSGVDLERYRKPPVEVIKVSFRD